MQRLRIGMLGAGTGRGQSWQSTLRKLSDRSELYDYCALCEVVEERARENAERWRVRPYTDLAAMLEEEGLDVLLNGVSSDSNPMAVGMAAKHGTHAITEIPIAPTLRIADHMVQTCERAGVRLEVTEQVFLWAGEQLKRRIIDSGAIGEITHARLWYTNKADYHGLNAVRMLLPGQAARVLGYSGKVRIPSFVGYEGELVEEDWWDAAVIEFDSGVVCLFEGPPRGRMSPRWDIEGTLGQLVGSNLYLGSVESAEHYPFRHEYTTVDGERILDHVRVDTDPPIVFENPYKEYAAADEDEVARMALLVGFYRAITQGTAPAYGAANARKDLEILFALRESARRGNTWIDLPLSAPTALEEELEKDFVRLYGHRPEEAEALARVPIPRAGVRWRVAGWD
ncbi:MAG: Gfo/Idh/MocA family oxidoreductase [Armatimonadetes bacterium]|nr:Gfo/Idh/MocA family oxidoreductase [Armatimonadota bacterium]